ncbi:MAG TPA: PHB depolymerase family esterase [Polyangiaceae bacterium]
MVNVRVAASVACFTALSAGLGLVACGGAATSDAPGRDAGAGPETGGSGSGSGGSTASSSGGSGSSGGGSGGSSGGDDAGSFDAGVVDAPIASGDASTGCGTAATAGMHDVTIQSGGMSRTFHVYVPAKYVGATSTPDTLVFVFHGYTQTGTGGFTSIEYLSQMDPVSDAQGFLLVYPDGYMNSWNAGSCCGAAVSSSVDDVGFFDDMVAWIESKYCVDPKRVYSAGLSNGGFFSNRLACERANVVAAIGPVAGPLDISPCNPSRPVPMLEVHGTSDPVVFFDGGSASAAMPVEQAVSTWEGFDKCTDSMPATVYTNGSATCTEETMCAGGAAVELCVIAGGGHQWPGGKDDYLGNFSSDLDTSTALMTFFQAHPMP